MDILTRVRLKGMRLAIDDFGTGYSSLKALRQLPFSEIKIDQSFVHDMTVSHDSRTIVKAIVDLARNMEMATVAEGVDSEEKALMLEEMNVDALQGFLIARSMPVEKVPRLAHGLGWRGDRCSEAGRGSRALCIGADGSRRVTRARRRAEDRPGVSVQALSGQRTPE